MFSSLRRRTPPVFIVLVLIVIGHSLAWLWATRFLHQQFDAWSNTAQSQGWHFQSAPLTQGGWPLSATLTAQNPQLRVQNTTFPQGIDWQADTLELRISIFHPLFIEFRLPGHQRFHVPAFLAADHLSLTTDALSILIPWISAHPHTAQIRGRDVHMGLFDDAPQAGTINETVFPTFMARIGWQPNPGLALTSFSVALHAPTIQLPPGPLRTLAPHISALTTQLQFITPFPPQKIEVPMLVMDWGDLHLDGQMQVQLRPDHPPSMTSALLISGYAPALNALAAAHQISPQQALAAKAMLDLLARTRPQGAPTVELPLAMNDGLLSAGQIPLLRLFSAHP